MLPDHSPEVVHCMLQRTLRQNVLMALLVPLWEGVRKGVREGVWEGGGRGRKGWRGEGGVERRRTGRDVI